MLCFYRKMGYIEGGFIILEEEGVIYQQRVCKISRLEINPVRVKRNAFSYVFAIF